MNRNASYQARSEQQHGIALLTVLWITAIMGIIATGLVSNVRTELRTMSSIQDRLQAQAQGQAAIYLALQQQPALIANNTNTGTLELNIQFAENTIPVILEPASRFLDINKVAVATLEQLFRSAGVSGNASELAKNVIEARERTDSGTTQREFEAIEDLLQVPGIHYDLYTNIAPLLTNMNQGTSEAVPGLVSPELARSLGISADSQAGTTSQSTNAYRAKAQVTLGNTSYEMVQDIILNSQSGMNNNTGLTWQILSTDFRVIPQHNGELFS